jgi:hypothetical protein
VRKPPGNNEFEAGKWNENTIKMDVLWISFTNVD